MLDELAAAHAGGVPRGRERRLGRGRKPRDGPPGAGRSRPSGGWPGWASPTPNARRAAARDPALAGLSTRSRTFRRRPGRRARAASPIPTWRCSGLVRLLEARPPAAQPPLPADCAPCSAPAARPRDRLLAVLDRRRRSATTSPGTRRTGPSCSADGRPPSRPRTAPAPRCSAPSAPTPRRRAGRGARHRRSAAGARRAARRLPPAAARDRRARPGRPRPSPPPSPTSRATLADLAAAALEAALAVARAELPAGSAPCRIAVLAMGKCGGRELNYVSDVDVIYVVEPARTGEGRSREAADEQGALATGTRLAARPGARLLRADGRGHAVAGRRRAAPRGQARPAGAHARQPPRLLPALGRDLGVPGAAQGAPRRGRRRLGQAYLGAIRPLVWRAAEREHFVEDVQAMRRRVEEHVPAKEAGRQLKLGPGRPARRRVQRAAAAAGARPGRPAAADRQHARGARGARHLRLRRARRRRRARPRLPVRCGRWSTGIQLYRLRRTHLVPTDPADLRRLGRAMQPGRATRPGELEAQWHRHALEVRRLHEKLFYRPSARRRRPAHRPTRCGSRPTPRGAARRPGLPRPRGRAAPPQRAHRGGEPARGDPAAAAAGAARLVRRRRRPRRRPARVPPAVGGAGHDALVPQDAARLRRGGRADGPRAVGEPARGAAAREGARRPSRCSATTTSSCRARAR